MPLLAEPTSDIQSLADAEVQRILKVQHPMMEGPDVRQVQQKLVQSGYGLPQFGIDGVYGEETAMAVQGFQEDHKLSVTGTVGPSTWKALQGGSTSTDVSTPGNISVTAITDYWDGLPASQKWMYAIGGTALIGGLGIAFLKK